MSNLFQTIFYQPILNFVVFIYNILPWQDIGLVIIVLLIVVRLILWPLNTKMLKSQKAMQALQPKLDELKKKHAGNKEALSREMMELYKSEKVNPFAGCLPLLVQLPIFFAIVRVFSDELSGKTLTLLYSFVHNPGVLNPIAFGFLNFAEKSPYLAVLAGLAQFVQAKLMPMAKPTVSVEGSKDESMAAMMNKQMLYLGPILTIVICWTVPSGLAFYWFLFSVVSIIQQWMIFRTSNK